MGKSTQQFIKHWTTGSTHLRSVGRSILLAAAVGAFTGLGASILHTLCETVAHFVLYRMAGYAGGSPAAHEDMLFHETALTLIPWLLILIPATGGLISGWLIYRFSPECAGGGAEAAIDSFHNRRGMIRTRVPLIKTLATALTLGTGGSGGREGPIAHIGAGIGSYLGTRLNLSASERRILVAAGMGAGIGAIFHAPLAGAIYAVEVLYRDPDFEAEALIPSFMATTVAYCVYNIILGVVFHADQAIYQPLFSVAGGESIRFRDPLLLLPITVLALVMTIASFVFVRGLQTAKWTFDRMPLRPWLKPAIGAGLSGVVALAIYYPMAAAGRSAQYDSLSVLAFGYGFLQNILNASLPSHMGIAIALLMVVALGKMVTTALTIESGGSAGVFGPSMVIGGALGAVVGLLFNRLMPGTVVSIPVFAILGMAAFFAAAANTPVGTLIMVTEMTASYELLLPAMWVCALSYLLSRGWSVYAAQVPTRVNSPAHRGDFLIDVLEGLSVREVLDSAGRNSITVLPGMLLQDVVHLFTDTKQTCFPVVNREGRYFGQFSLSDVRQFLYDSELGALAVAHDLASPCEPLSTRLDLHSAIERFVNCQFEELPVIDPDAPDHLIGMLRRQDVIATYNAKLIEMRRDDGPTRVSAW